MIGRPYSVLKEDQLLDIIRKFHPRRHTELIIDYLNEPPYKFGIKIWLLADMNN